MRRAAMWIGFQWTVAVALGVAGALPEASRAQGLDELLPGRDVIVRPDETLVVRGNSPRRRGIVPQYNHLRTPLRANLTFSDTLLPSDRWTRWTAPRRSGSTPPSRRLTTTARATTTRRAFSARC